MKSPLNRKNKIALVHFMAMLSMVRWYNILALFTGLTLFSVFVLNNSSQWMITLTDINLFWMLSGMCFVIMSGYIINAFYDVEKDLVNNAKSTVFGKHVSKRKSFNLYFAFNTIGVLLGALVNWKMAIFQSAFIFVLWFYSHKLRKMPVVGEISASLLLLVPFGCITAYYKGFDEIVVLYLGFLFAIEFTREIVKKLEVLRGDIIYAYGSIATLLGERKTKWVVIAIMIITLCLIGALHPIVRDNIYTMLFLVITSISLIVASVLLIKAESPIHYSRIQFIYKVILGLAIVCIVFV
ncbi:MAG: geranylgeranylglycerol-phosphate geranylgeranyltransferase [Bacteroidota bacterium]